MDVLLAMKRKNKNRFDVKIVQVVDVEAGSSFEIVPKFPDMA